jgi:hypothetical protein
MKEPRLLAIAIAAVPLVLLFGTAIPASADQTTSPPLQLATLDLTTLIPADDPIMTDPATNTPATNDPPHLPPGSKFKLIGSAKDDIDPFNSFNEVISTDPVLLPPAQQTPDCAPFCNSFGDAYKKFGDKVKIGMLTNMLGVKYFFPSRTCGGGSPRIQLGIDGDGDGKFNQTLGGPDQNAFGYVGHGGFGSGCVTGSWDYIDLTDSVPARWDLSQFGLGYHNWSTAVAAITAAYPNHRVLNGILVDDAGWYPPASGCAYYDLVTIGARTLDTHDDTNNNPDAPNSC